ncbi:MAG: 30S ribosomal protein S3 [Bacteroidia bacterium]|nr:30S ribosomal protein S3 [Bacteroidia bacterium]MDW8134415.1 30S ribosomal protein S3 [Bacteroidia bacterium]
MGQKTHPIGFRLGVTKGWYSNWYAGRRMAPYIILDQLFREHIEKTYPKAQIAHILINRTSLRATHVIIYAARPGVIIGKDGSNIKKLQQDLAKIVRRFNRDYRNLLLGKRAELGASPELISADNVEISLREVLHPELEAVIVAKNIAEQLEARMSHRRVMKSAIAQAMRAGAQGVKIRCTGRLGGADMSRSEEYREGHIALQTLRSDISYGTATAYTIYGATGVKVWILRGTLYGKVDLFPWLEEGTKSGKAGRKDRKK